ncbi:DUF4255 domain-containing protein [Mucilaginibacter polytrichastri]|uniref:Pvc16 N-terminal domain-containing protein n=1 Tax=Mucilaginibacter polytrichastri TaxID=1302689 RepID=A0A1Q5ZXP1_9SPHI|nr:DUF4255 domain-containing protein [Mucilaginibacter polytrichastri]OKS86523.1 hypothetical protein RG47T_1979 [Mucilaginibacter polytrichastri]SFS79489.1 Protein of unknown function [Mucilaginibacter polytrichastri]
MILETLTCLTDDINEYFRNKLRINEDKVVLSGIINQDGTIAIQGENKIIVTIVNIEKEVTGQSNAGSAGGSSTFANRATPLNINLYVLFSSYFSSGNYTEALRFLSFTIAYFQHKNVFTRSNTPALDERIDKLIFELASFTPEQVNNVWSSLGAKYMPSVIYKIRMLSFDESIIREYRPSVSGINSDNAIN